MKITPKQSSITGNVCQCDRGHLRSTWIESPEERSYAEVGDHLRRARAAGDRSTRVGAIELCLGRLEESLGSERCLFPFVRDERGLFSSGGQPASRSIAEGQLIRAGVLEEVCDAVLEVECPHLRRHCDLLGIDSCRRLIGRIREGILETYTAFCVSDVDFVSPRLCTRRAIFNLRSWF